MRAKPNPPAVERDKYYESSSSMIRWICIILLLITYPFATPGGLIVLTWAVAYSIYNALRYSTRVQRITFFRARELSLAIDHVFVLAIVLVSGGLSSQYYPFFFILIVTTIASYGIAGFAFSLSAQIGIAILLLLQNPGPLSLSAASSFLIKLVFLLVFSIMAEQFIRNRNEEYLLESRFTIQVETERERLLALINSLSSAVLAVDTKGRVHLYNAAALEFLNTNEDITGAEINHLLPLQDKTGRRVNLVHLATGHERLLNRQDLVYDPGDGSKIIVDLTISPVHGYGRGNWGGYMAVFRDITKEKSLDEERDEFISVTSHELRTPLAVAEANVSTALLPRFAKIEPKARDLLNQAHENLVFLSKLIQDLATLSRAERGDLKLTRTIVNTREFAGQLTRDYTAQATSKHIRLLLNIDGTPGNLYTSEPELREILQNFITNAIKYTPRGAVTLEVSQAGQDIRFAVLDTGIGIAASDKAKIFSKFYRSEDYRTRQTGGTGLGLYITRKLAEKLGAKIDFTSHLNHGSTFAIVVPQGAVDSDAVTEHAQTAGEAVPA